MWFDQKSGAYYILWWHLFDCMWVHHTFHTFHHISCTDTAVTGPHVHVRPPPLRALGSYWPRLTHLKSAGSFHPSSACQVHFYHSCSFLCIGAFLCSPCVPECPARLCTRVPAHVLWSLLRYHHSQTPVLNEPESHHRPQVVTRKQLLPLEDI